MTATLLKRFLCAAAFCCCAALVSADEAKTESPYVPADYHPESSRRPIMLAQTTDFLDNAFFFQGDGDYYTIEELRKRIKLAYDSGFRKIYFRGTGGVSYYPSKIRGPYRGGHYEQGANRLIKTIQSYDTVAEFLKCCHELGMQCYYWETIFDNALYLQCFPGMKNYEKLGERPCGDPALKPEYCVEHRKAYLPQANFAQTVTCIKLRLLGKPLSFDSRSLKLYTGPHGQPFTEYAKPYTVTCKPESFGTLVTVSDLEVDDPVIKFALEGMRAGISVRDGNAVEAFYADGSRSELNACVEVTLGGDSDRLHLQRGCAPGTSDAFGHPEGQTDVTMIARFGDVERHAWGVPEFAIPQARERLKAIVTELYDRYPELDGITFSIRTHSIPATGSYENLGYGNFFYGFSQPIVDEYKAKHGIDIRKEPYDEKEFLRIRGKYLTQVLGEVSEIVHARGGKLEMMAPVRTSTHDDTTTPGMVRFALGSMFLWWQHTDIDDFFDITTWAKKGYVDSIIMLGTAYKQTQWSKRWDDEIARFRKHLEGTSVRLSLHLEVYDRPGNTKYMESLLPQLLKTDLDELEFYEENAMYLYDFLSGETIYPTTKRLLHEAEANRPVLYQVPIRKAPAKEEEAQ